MFDTMCIGVVAVIADLGECCDFKGEGLLRMLYPFSISTLPRGGSIAYMAPEIAFTKAGPNVHLNYDKADIWSLGHVLVNMISNHLSPFDNRTKTLLHTDIISSTYPGVLHTLLHQLIVVDPSKRISCHELYRVASIMYDMNRDHQHEMDEMKRQISIMATKEAADAIRIKQLESQLERLSSTGDASPLETKTCSTITSIAQVSTIMDNDLYCISGYSSLDNTMSNVIRLHDGKWSSVTRLPTPRIACACARIADHVYVSGGRDTYIKKPESKAYNIMERLHIPSMTWTVVSPMPRVRQYHQMIVVGHELYAMGGYMTGPSSPTINDVDIYDTRTDQWRKGIPMISSRANFGACVLNNVIYCMGGTDAYGSTMRSCEKFDIVLQRWLCVSNMPVSGNAPAIVTCVDSHSILVIGGLDHRLASDTLVTIKEYLPTSDTWHRRPFLLPQVRGIAGVWYQSSTKSLIIAGGRSHSSTTPTISTSNGVTDDSLPTLSRVYPFNDDKWFEIATPLNRDRFAYC
jgi:hypothetical protein